MTGSASRTGLRLRGGPRPSARVRHLAFKTPKVPGVSDHQPGSCSEQALYWVSMVIISVPCGQPRCSRTLDALAADKVRTVLSPASSSVQSGGASVCIGIGGNWAAVRQDRLPGFSRVDAPSVISGAWRRPPAAGQRAVKRMYGSTTSRCDPHHYGGAGGSIASPVQLCPSARLAAINSRGKGQ